jgi:hypothetical protein
VLVVDEYRGATDEYGVGAHAYALVNVGGRVVVRDAAEPGVHGLPVVRPREVRGTYAVFFDREGNPVDPVARAGDGIGSEMAVAPGELRVGARRFDDEWERYDTAARVAAALEGRFPEIILMGFDRDVDVAFAREVARAVERIELEFPPFDGALLDLADLGDDLASTSSGVMPGGRIIKLDKGFAAEPHRYREGWAESEFGRRIGPADRAAYGITLFMLARLVNDAGNGTAARPAMRLLAERYRAVHGSMDRAGFTDWLQRQFTSAAFRWNGVFEVGDALQESVAVMLVDPAAATDGQRILSDLAARQVDPANRAELPTSCQSFVTAEPADEWSRLPTPAAVVAALRERYSVRTTLSGTEVADFELPSLAVESMREIARAVAELFRSCSRPGRTPHSPLSTSPRCRKVHWVRRTRIPRPAACRSS